MYKAYKQYLATLKDTGKYRQLPATNLPDNYLNFASNDYLGFSTNKELIEAANLAAIQYGIGSTGSRLLSGNNSLFENFEAEIARDKNAESALIFSSGFQANISTLAALLDQKVLGVKPIVFFDRLNHASLYQAIFLSGAELQRYHHNNAQHLSDLLDKFEWDPRPKFIVTETVFGMDGDILPIEQIAHLAAKHQAFLYLDEAHSTGLLGTNGYGLSTTINLGSIPHLVMGTFSKALGSIGGYIACSQIIKDYLINKASGFIYSTANSPATVAAARKSWSMIKDLDEERQNLFDLSANLRQSLQELGFNTAASATNIIPIIIGDEHEALRLRDKLLENKIIVSCIRPPTVPPGTSRVRIALTTKHTKQDVELLIQALKDNA